MMRRPSQELKNLPVFIIAYATLNLYGYSPTNYYLPVPKTYMMKQIFLFAAVALVFINAYAQTLSKTEQKIVANIDADMAATIQLLKASVDINSGTFNIAGVKKTGELYAKELQALGFTVIWVPMPDSIQRA